LSEPKFVAKADQVDYSNIRYCPVINCVLVYQDKLLLVQRSKDLRTYPGYWNGVSGYLDDNKSVQDKAYEELNEELGLIKDDVVSISLGHVFSQEADEYKKTWIVFPVLVEVRTDKIKLDWEADAHKWLNLSEARKVDLMPGFNKVLDTLFS
jgi:8-oxo-dGTP pyrophosphatase MutT (NUDIX family)